MMALYQPGVVIVVCGFFQGNIGPSHMYAEIAVSGFKKFIVVIVFSGLAPVSLAERCATPQEVRARLVSPDYEWSVSEEASLDDILAVEKLYGASIENYGEFIACKYEAPQKYIRLDGVPKDGSCPIQAASDNWFSSEAGKSVCEEDDVTLCRFSFACQSLSAQDPEAELATGK